VVASAQVIDWSWRAVELEPGTPVTWSYCGFGFQPGVSTEAAQPLRAWRATTRSKNGRLDPLKRSEPPRSKPPTLLSLAAYICLCTITSDMLANDHEQDQLASNDDEDHHVNMQ
jgi:hypothetical protein